MKQNSGPFRPIHYLGSKLRVSEDVESLLYDLDPSNGRVCDLFSGSGTLSGYLSRKRPVTSVDVQEYSKVLCSALTQKSSKNMIDCKYISSSIRGSELYLRLEDVIRPLVLDESSRLDFAARGDVVPIASLIKKERLLYVIDGLELVSNSAASFVQRFGGLYFSYRQAADLAAIVNFAHQCTEDRKWVILLGAMSAASEVVNTVGKQFAQPIRLEDRHGNPKKSLARQVVRDRSLDVFVKFEEAISRYNDLPDVVPGSKSLKMDYEEALRNHCDDVSIVYADPPYTRDHYSRYYHVLESMCLQDSPSVSRSKDGSPLRGMYRDDRHQSPFCIKTQAPKAFERLFEGGRRIGVPLVVSYSPLAETDKPRPRVMLLEEVREIARRSYAAVDIVPVGDVSHSKLNSGKHNSPVTRGAEMAFVCAGPR